MYYEARNLIDNSHSFRNTEPGSHNFRPQPMYCNTDPGGTNEWRLLNAREVDIGPWENKVRIFELLKTSGFLDATILMCYYVVESSTNADTPPWHIIHHSTSILSPEETVGLKIEHVNFMHSSSPTSSLLTGMQPADVSADE